MEGRNFTNFRGSSAEERETFSSSVRSGRKGSHQRDESTEVEVAMREVQVRAWELNPTKENGKCRVILSSFAPLSFGGLQQLPRSGSGEEEVIC